MTDFRLIYRETISKMTSFPVADGAGGVAYVHRIRGHILGHYSTRPYDAPIPDRNPRKDGGVSTDPTILSDGYRQTSHPATGPPFDRVAGMVGSDEMTIRSDSGVVPYGDACGVQEGAVVVDCDILPDDDVESQITSEREQDER